MKQFKKIMIVAFVIMMTIVHHAHAAPVPTSPFTVNSNLDTNDAALDGICDDGDGHCTLRAAITEANNNTDVTTINFSSAMTIVLSGSISIITPVVLDASGVGSCPTPGVIIDTNDNATAFQLGAGSDGTTIKGLVINNYDYSGLTISGVSGSTSTFACNWIGLDATGESAAGANDSISITNSGNLMIGGYTSADRNVFSGNQLETYSEAIALGNSSTGTSIAIVGNYFSTNKDGTVYVGNGTGEGEGIDFYTNTGVTDLLIEGNLFAGSGASIDGVSGIQVLGNTFGVASDGTTLFTGVSQGDYLNFKEGVTNVEIGGTGENEGNVFAGTGVSRGIQFSGTTYVNAKGNFFGVANDGVTPLYSDGFYDAVIQATNDADHITIGGTAADDRNIILNPITSAGIGIGINSSSNITIQGNYLGETPTAVVYSAGEVGVSVINSSQVVVGGPAAGAGNVISGTNIGIFMVANQLGEVTIQKNVIRNNVRGILIGSTVLISEEYENGGSLIQNAIYNNSSLGIDIAHDADGNILPEEDIGEDTNDYLDSDRGANDKLNHPVLISAYQDGTSTMLTYMTDVPVSGYPYHIEFFKNPNSVASGAFGQGEVYITAVDKILSVAGPQIATILLPNTDLIDGVSATITQCRDAECNSFGGTSEFSNYITNTRGGIDLGTAGGSQTALSDGGPYHVLYTGGGFLGVSATADTEGSVDQEDRNGVTFDKTSYPLLGTMTVTVTPNTDGYLSVWMDVNNDGSFSGVDEWYYKNHPVTSGANTLSIPALGGAGVHAIRFRFVKTVPTHDILATGEAIGGEVEDYTYTISSNSGTSSGYSASSRFTPGNASSSPSSNITPNDTDGTCPADQMLTQNLKAGARNGKYHSYTKAVVKEVKILQAHMNRLGFNSGPVDGILGKLTDGAIKRMQKFLGTYQDGKIGPITRSLINKSCGLKGLKQS